VSPGEIAGIFGAGMAAGTINTIVGSGSLITFPTLLAFGYPAVVANVSNTIGLAPGNASGAYGYRDRLSGQGRRILELGAVALAGGIVGALLLMLLPESAFDRVVPILILMAVVLVAIQPRVARWLASRRGEGGSSRVALWLAVFGCSVYGGYFGAAQGVILIATLGILVPDDLQRLNGVKNVLVMLVNGVAAILFFVIAPIAWPAVLLLAGGSVLGGQVGARVGKRMPAPLLRGLIIVIGTIVGVRLLVA
jgi:uncharacterized membrane protein YfcA